MLRATTTLHVHGHRRRRNSAATQTTTVQDTTAPEFTFVPADYTVEADEMPMDDATASDNCGEVTIEVSSETTAGDAAGNYTIVRTFTATDDAGNSLRPRRRSRSKTPPPGFTFVPPTTLLDDANDDASVDNCGEVTIEGRAKRPLAMPRATTIAALTATDAEQRSPRRRSRSKTPPRLSSPSSLPTTP